MLSGANLKHSSFDKNWNFALNFQLDFNFMVNDFIQKY